MDPTTQSPQPIQQEQLPSQKMVAELFHTQFWKAIKQTKEIHNRIVPETLKHYLAKAVSHPDFIRQIIPPPPPPSYKVYLKTGNGKGGHKLRTMNGGASFPTEQSAEQYAAYFCRETYISRNDLFIIPTSQ